MISEAKIARQTARGALSKVFVLAHINRNCKTVPFLTIDASTLVVWRNHIVKKFYFLPADMVNFDRIYCIGACLSVSRFQPYMKVLRAIPTSATFCTTYILKEPAAYGYVSAYCESMTFHCIKHIQIHSILWPDTTETFLLAEVFAQTR